MFITRLRCLLAAATAASLLLVASPASALAPSDANRNVINGTVVPRPSITVPWALSLYYAEDSYTAPQFICTATALGPLEVLTAAHCVARPGFYYVRVGTNMINRGRLIAVEAIDANKGYRPATTKDDVAVLRSLERLNLRSYARVATPTMAANVRSGKQPGLTLYGWGVTERGELTGNLRTASLLTQTAAARVAFKGAFVDQLMLAAGRYNPKTGQYSGGCNGDSGGPLVTHVGGVPYVVGITSFGARDCNLGTPTVFTSVGNYSSWIAGSRHALPALAVRSNRAVPVMRTAPAISGAVAAGATLTCTPGTWTDNARRFNFRWSRGTNPMVVATGATYQVSPSDAGQKLVCTVGVASQAGLTEGSASVAAGLAPQPLLGQWTKIGGIADNVAVAPDTVATCTPATFEPAGVVVTQAWFSRRFAGDVLLPLSTGPTLTLTRDLLLQIASAPRQLLCVAIGTNSMGTASAQSFAVTLPPLYPPTVNATLAPVPEVAGTIATCGAQSNLAAAVLTYEWAIEPAVTSGPTFSAAAQLLGVGPSYTLTDADVVALQTGLLACRATATMWYGTSSDVTVLP